MAWAPRYKIGDDAKVEVRRHELDKTWYVVCVDDFLAYLGARGEQRAFAFITNNNGTSWFPDERAVSAGLADDNQQIPECALVDQLRAVLTKYWIPVQDPPIAVASEANSAFDDAVGGLDQMLSDVALPPDAYDADGKLKLPSFEPWPEKATDETIWMRAIHELARMQHANLEDLVAAQTKLGMQIQGAADGQVLRRIGSSLNWGNIDLADHDAVTGLLPTGNEAVDLGLTAEEEAFFKDG